VSPADCGRQSPHIRVADIGACGPDPEKVMRIRRIAILATFAAGLAALPISPLKAQYYPPPPCSPFPLFWPFCVAGALVVTAATIVTAPFWALTGTPPYYYGYYGQPYDPYYPPPAPAYSPAPSYIPQPTYAPQAGRSRGNIARQLNQQELNRLQAAPFNPPPPPYYPPRPRY